ncbi:MAG: RIP metalloprotease RseP [Pseudomonadota bacterium]
MELILGLPVIGVIVGTIIPFLIVLGVVVFVHEYGHYIVGRWCGIGAETFSIGFGPKLMGWRDKRGTEWQVAALPLGGFVKFVGDMDPASVGRIEDTNLTQAQRKEAFHNASLRSRALTVAAGPFFNFGLSILIFAALGLYVGASSDEPIVGEIGESSTQETLPFVPGDRVLSIAGEPVETFTDVIRGLQASDGEPVTATVEREGEVVELQVAYGIAPTIDSVLAGRPASRAGLLPGDLFKSLNGEAMSSFREIQLEIAELPLNEPVTLVIERDGEERTFTFVPDVMERVDPVTGETRPIATLGISAHSETGVSPLREPIGLVRAAEVGVSNTWNVISNTVSFLGDLVFASADPSQLGGPIRIAQVSGERAQRGLLELIHLIALLSTSIGLLNLFPIPVLDGGHLMFYAAEALRGRPVGETAMKYGTMIGLSLVLLLMVFATYNDILRL